MSYKTKIWTIQEKIDGEWKNTTYNTFSSLDAEQALGSFRKSNPCLEYRLIFNDPWHTNIVW